MRSIRALLQRYARLPRWVRLAGVLLWAVLVWWLSSKPGSALPSLPLGSLFANGAHVALFGILGGLLFFAWTGPLPRRFCWSAGSAAAFGVVDELHQTWVPGRSSSIADVLSDASGALLVGCVLMWALGRDRRAARALPWVLALTMGAVCLATLTDL